MLFKKNYIYISDGISTFVFLKYLMKIYLPMGKENLILTAPNSNTINKITLLQDSTLFIIN